MNRELYTGAIPLGLCEGFQPLARVTGSKECLPLAFIPLQFLILIVQTRSWDSQFLLLNILVWEIQAYEDSPASSVFWGALRQP